MPTAEVLSILRNVTYEQLLLSLLAAKFRGFEKQTYTCVIQLCSVILFKTKSKIIFSLYINRKKKY